MTRFLRTVSTRRLLAMVAGLLIAAVGGTTIALAAIGNGPVPRPTSLANAIHEALSAKAPAGISARINFTDNLIGATELEGVSDPLLTGASGRLWLTGDHLRIELQSDTGDGQIVVDGRSLWIYDPSSNTVYEGTLPAAGAKGKRVPATRSATTDETVPSITQIQSELNKLVAHLRISGPDPTDVAGQAAYRVQISPKGSGGLVGAISLAWDAIRGVPLDIGLYARGDSTPVLELQATDISYGSVPLSDFAISPPTGAKVIKLGGSSAAASGSTTASRAASKGKTPPPLGFTASAPKQAGGLSLATSRRLGDAELLTYGTGLAGVEVLEQEVHGSAAGSGGSAGPGAGGVDSGELAMPTVSINGVPAEELSTEIGTLLQFQRGGVGYVVFGSVPASTAEAVARGL